MSIPVELHELRTVAAMQAPFAYLLSVSDDGRPHSVAIVPNIGDDEITFSAGRRSCANAAVRPDVALLWPPRAPGEYSLICDGVATVDGETIHIAPTRAVRHRPAVGGGSDCAPVTLTTEA